MGEVVELRDFKRREEKEATDVRLAKEIVGLIPSDMPSVQPNYRAPEKDPA